MRWAVLAKVLFILYCVEAGALFSLLPWSAAWEQGAMRLTLFDLRAFCLHPLVRSGMTGFGVLHLVWGAHDLDLLLSQWRQGGQSSP